VGAGMDQRTAARQADRRIEYGPQGKESRMVHRCFILAYLYTGLSE
jgi:hypothetical protein